MSSALKAFLVAGGVLAAGAVIGYVALGPGFGPQSVLTTQPLATVTSPLYGPLKSHLIPPSTPNPFDPPYDTLLGANAAYGLYPDSVDPVCGPFEGGTAVTISGDFDVIPAPLTAAQADSAYWVYFGAVLAQFDPAFDPAAVVPGVDGEFHVLTPVGPTTGPVDVTMISRADGYYANMVDAYTYFEAFELYEVDPNTGPAAGGNAVQIRPDVANGGQFPIHQAITTAAQAASIYRVFFGANQATFDDSGGDPVTATAINVFAPPGPGATTVDVRVEEIGNPCNVNTLVDAYTYESSFLLTDVTPQYGYTRGGLDVTITGTFDIPGALTLVEATNTYAVFFDGVRADFREGVPGVAMDTSNAYVVSPAHLAPTPAPDEAHVRIEEIANPSNFGEIEDAFEYIALEILSVTPDLGPTTGGQSVKITAFLSIVDPLMVDTAAEAYNAYIVYFGNEPITLANRANFDDFPPPPGVAIVPPTSDIPDRTDPDRFETAAMMYVITPPGDPGLVDVLVIDANNAALPIEDRLDDGYEYEADNEIGQWIGVDVLPEVVGPLDGGDLRIRLETTSEPTGGNWDGINVFLMPQGGDPTRPEHRIPLDFVSSSGVSPFVTTWTNAANIETLVWDEDASGGPSSGDIFADGHAAIMVEDLSGIYGDDVADPSDGGVILEIAGTTTLLDPQVYRHVTIDTIPPVMVPAPNPARGSNLVTLNIGALGNLTQIAPAPPSQVHPASTAGAGLERNNNNLVDSEDEIEAGVYHVEAPDTRAQVFVNVGSDDQTNDFDLGDDPLDIDIEVRFYDPDLYEYYEEYAPSDERVIITPSSTTDGDIFNSGNTTRHPSGFRPGAFPADRNDLTVSDSLSGGLEANWIQWRLAPGSDTISPTLRTDVTFTLGTTLPGNPSVPNSSFADNLTAIIDFDTTSQPGGIPEPPGSETLHWALYFLGHDTAGWVLNNYFWTKGDTPASLEDRILTPMDTVAGPLHIWWIRNSSARIVPNLEGVELYDQDIGFELNRGFSIPLDPAPSLDVQPLPVFSYRLWRSTVPGQGGYDAEYEPVPGLTAWQAFDDQNFINTLDDVTNAATTPEDVVNRWILIQVLGIDESGNYGQFPTDELTYEFEGNPAPNDTGNITEFLAGSGASWMRFFLLEQPSSVDTRIRPTIWYDSLISGTQGQIDPGERVLLGAPTILQAPDVITAEQIRIRFQIDAVVNDPAVLANSDIEWSVSRRNSFGSQDVPGAGWAVANLGGASTITIDFARNAAGAQDIGIDLDNPPTGNPGPADDGGPTTLVFRFRTVTPTVTDSTPATYSVTVVDDIEEFVENRGARDNQPIKETSR